MRKIRLEVLNSFVQDTGLLRRVEIPMQAVWEEEVLRTGCSIGHCCWDEEVIITTITIQ